MDSANWSHAPDLLEHVDWVRDLARSLVGDPDLADDLAQETFLAALRSPSEAPRSLKSWLASVLRRRMSDRFRREGRVQAREEEVAKRDTAPSTVELLERLSVQRAVADEVESLPATYRDVLLRRYFDNMTPKEIALGDMYAREYRGGKKK